ncbi:MAG: glycosyltransferase family 2 protein, partial [Pseudolabrys sp.]|nr:glycosyltransferase family 2 protein [Pseudolabrys sp.]
YYAFCDQDDIWDADKLSSAVAQLEQAGAAAPAMYCTRTRLIDETGRDLGLSTLHARRPSFANALVQSLGGANTMVFNRATKKLAAEIGAIDAASHDWWIYLLTTAVGGVAIYDPEPHIGYRMHGINIVGSNTGFFERSVRIRKLFSGQLRQWTDAHLAALHSLRSRMPAGNQTTLDRFTHARQAAILPRLCGFLKSGIYRQTALGNAGLAFAAVFKKI